MTYTILGSLAGVLLGWLMGFLSLFLILLVLIQRGKGGGLTGALGGPGGHSAFGSKAGDTFTFITIIVASVWALTCAFTMWLLGTHTPTPISDTNISAGPSDQPDEDDGSVRPTNELSGFGAGGLEGIGSTGTPSADIEPTTESDSTDEATAPDADPAGGTDETDSTEGDSNGSTPEEATTEGETSDDPAASGGDTDGDPADTSGEEPPNS